MKTAIITGASRGIGRAIALQLGKQNHSVVVNYMNSNENADEVVNEIKENGGNAVSIKANVSNLNEVQHLFNETKKHFKTIDILINNAGVSGIGPLTESDDEIFDTLFHINVKGTLNGLKCAYDHLQKGGRIINFSSTTVASSTPGMGIYAATKAAIETLTKVFAKEIRGREITVNAIAPGLVSSAMFEQGKTEEQLQQMSQLSPLERLGTVEEIANVVSFLASSESSWINGQVIRVNGGVL